MPEEPFALSTISRLPAEESDYDAICATVMESARGRWFLQEYPQRNRNADTRLVLAAIERLEHLIRTERNQQAHPGMRAEFLEMARAIAQARAEDAGGTRYPMHILKRQEPSRRARQDAALAEPSEPPHDDILSGAWELAVLKSPEEAVQSKEAQETRHGAVASDTIATTIGAPTQPDGEVPSVMPARPISRSMPRPLSSLQCNGVTPQAYRTGRDRHCRPRALRPRFFPLCRSSPITARREQLPHRAPPQA